MGRLRQLPQFYLRGAIANETMKHLPPEEVGRINVMVEDLARSALLAGHRQEFVNKLSQTIGGDYRDDRSTADAEFKIAIWRAVVYLLHHTNYSYRCLACNSGAYLTQRSKPKIFDRRYPHCPHCNRVRITTSTNAVWEPGTFVLLEDVQTALLQGHSVDYGSPIEPIKGDRKVADHDLVLSDEEQLGKFLSEFIWNYFRQILRENEIKHHQMDGTWLEGASGKKKFVPRQSVCGPADKIAVEEVLSVLASTKFPHNYQQGANPQGGHYHIQADLDCADAALVERLTALVCKYERLRVRVRVEDRGVYVREAKGRVPTVEALVIKPQVVALLTGAPRIGGDGGEDSATSVIDTNHHRIVGGKSMQEDGIARFEADDLLEIIHASLPQGAKQVLEIYTQTGETWRRFCVPENDLGNVNGSKPTARQTTARQTTHQNYTRSEADTATLVKPTPDRPSPPQIAKFLGVSPKQVKQWISDIRIHCLAHGLIPGS